MKLLITGSSGFIGGYFIDKYKKQYDIHSFSFRENDINTLNCKNIDTILHLSALVHQMGGASKDEYEKVNVEQTLILAQKAKEQGVKHFVFMSTVKVYGEESETIYTEETPCYPEDDYGISKLKAEKELVKLEDEKFKVSIIRTPIVYGYGVKANIKNLIGLINKINILPFKNIKNKRSMVYIGNLSHLVSEIIIQEKNGVFLASDDKSLSTSELVNLIGKSLDRKALLFRIPFFQTLLKTIKPSFHKRLFQSLEVNNDKTKKTLNLTNPYSTEKGIEFMIKGEE